MKKIIALGESHHGTHLEEVKKYFNEQENLSGIFLELPVNYQDSVNKYLKERKIEEDLERHFAGAMKEGKDVRSTLLFILDFAIEKEIPVICIDSSKIQTEKYNTKSKFGRYFLNGQSRDEDMFNNVIDNLEGEGFWIVFCGAGHLVDEIHHRTGEKNFSTWMQEKFKENFQTIILK